MKIGARLEAGYSKKWKLFGFTTCALLFALCFQAQAQQSKKIGRIGFLNALSLSAVSSRIEAFQTSLRELGYADGQNITVEYRHTGDTADQLPTLAAELVGLRVNVIVAVGSQAVFAAQRATDSIPIVMTGSSDPVGTGFVASLARPGGNITGLSLLSPELSGKRLELLKEIVVRRARFAVLWNPADPPAVLSWKETESAAQTMGLKLQSIEAREPNDFEGAFKSITTQRSGGLIILPAPIMTSHARQIAQFAIKNKLPSISFSNEFPEAGGLMSYGANFLDLFRRAAVYVDKILKGAKPADLPVEQPKKFDFVVNLKTAKQIGLTIPPNVLARADKVIR